MTTPQPRRRRHEPDRSAECSVIAAHGFLTLERLHPFRPRPA